MPRHAMAELRGIIPVAFVRSALPAIASGRQKALRLVTAPRSAWPAVLAAALTLAACGTPPGSFDVVDSPQTKIANLEALVQFKKMPRQPEPTDHVACPNIIILDGTADDRVYAASGDKTNANLRYQFSLNDVARDCQVVGDKISLKIGVAGKVLLGPVGAPGNFAAPIRIAIIREGDQSVAASQLFQVPVTVPAGQTEAPFTLVTDQMSVPHTHANAQLDYTIKVGFDAGGDSKAPPRGHPRAHRQSAPPASPPAGN